MSHTPNSMAAYTLNFFGYFRDGARLAAVARGWRAIRTPLDFSNTMYGLQAEIAALGGARRHGRHRKCLALLSRLKASPFAERYQVKIRHFEDEMARVGHKIINDD